MRIRKNVIIFFLSVMFVCAVTLFVDSNYQSLCEHRARSFTQAAWEGQIWKMRILRFLGADLNEDAPGNGPAMIAAAWTGKKDVIRYLLKNGANVNQHDKFRWTALIAAVNGGHRETVEFLISNGADINAVGEDGSALRRAIEKNNAEMVNLLLKHGAIDRYGFQAVNSK